MADTGWLNLTTFSSDSSQFGTAWTNTGNAAAEDGTEATSSGGQSEYMKGLNLGASAVPTGATINGVECRVKWRNRGSFQTYLYRVRLVKGGVIGTTDLSAGEALDNFLSFKTWGSSIQKWGFTLLDTDINASGIGFVVQVGNGGKGTFDCGIDVMQMKIYYTGGGGGSPVSVTPGVLNLTTTKFAPTVRLGKILVPAKLSLATMSFAPTIRLNKKAIPGKLSLTLSTFAPTIRLNKIVTPGKLSLALSTFAPTIRLNKIATPGKLSLVTTSFAPTVRTPRVLVPGKLSLSLNTFAPTIRTPQTVVPGKLSLTLTTFAPSVIVANRVTPGTRALTLTTFAPTTLTPRRVTPATASLVLTTFAPKTVIGKNVVPGTRSLTLTAFAPTVRTPRLVQPAKLSLAFTTFAPLIAVGQVVTPATNALTLTTFAPTIKTPRVITPATAALTVTRFAPTVAAPRVVIPGTASLTLTRFAPTLRVQPVVVPSTLALSLTTYAPTIIAPQIVRPGTASLILTRFAPTVLAPIRRAVRVLQKNNRYNHQPFAGRGASLYVGIGDTPDAIQFHKIRVLGNRFVRLPGSFTIANGVRKGCFVAQVQDPETEFNYTFPPEWHGQTVWIQVRPFWNHTELPSNFGAVRILVGSGGELEPEVLATGEIIAIEKRDGGIYRLRTVYQPNVDGLQPDTLLIRKTAGTGTLADVELTIERSRYYEFDTATLTNAVSYTFALLARSGATELQLDSVTFTADAAGPPAATGLSLSPA